MIFNAKTGIGRRDVVKERNSSLGLEIMEVTGVQDPVQQDKNI